MIINHKSYDITVYKVKKKDEYCYIHHKDYRFITDNRGHNAGYYEGFFVERDDSRLPVSHAECCFSYLEDCYPLSFAKLPRDVQAHLLDYLEIT